MFTTLLKTLLDAWRVRALKRKAYYMTRQLNDHLLKDIGLTRPDLANFAAFKMRAVDQKRTTQRSQAIKPSRKQTNSTGSAKGMLSSNSWPERKLAGDGNA